MTHYSDSLSLGSICIIKPTKESYELGTYIPFCGFRDSTFISILRSYNSKCGVKKLHISSTTIFVTEKKWIDESESMSYFRVKLALWV